MADADEEIVMMTPFPKNKGITSIRIAKVKKHLVDASQVKHLGGGKNAGLVINKAGASDPDANIPPSLQLEFKCFLADKKTGKHIPESRVLKFWFAPETDYLDKVTGAYEFFKELVKPDEFPRDYMNFIKRVMMMIKQEKYRQLKRVEVDMKQLEEETNTVPSPGLPKEDNRPREAIVQEQVLHTLEHAYPNILPLDELAKLTHSDEYMVQQQLALLKGRNLIRELEPGKWVRKVLDEKTEVKIVKNIPQQTAGMNPTIAIITSKYYEKLAVDAMMENKTTFVRFKSEGESNVYTIGDIGSHKVVSTKLPALGRGMAAQISSGNTTTRLLGSFADIEHVLLVGTAGGVPHFTDFHKHARLGDVVFATPNDKGSLYIFCEDIIHDQLRGTMQYKLKSWSPRDAVILQKWHEIQERFKDAPMHCPWQSNIEEGAALLQGQEVNFSRPPPDTDKLYMNIGGNDVIEVGHPPIPDDAKSWYDNSIPMMRQGPIGAGKPIVQDDALRQDFALRHSCSLFDTEFDQVLESIVGNRKDSFAFIRGVADYLDGTKNVEWQPYAALAAAGFMKTLIQSLPEPGYSS